MTYYDHNLPLELAETFVNGNRSYVKDALTNAPSPLEAAKLAVAVREELEALGGSDAEVYERWLEGL